ncbi:hypothetical protein [Kineococcus sp. SYSU DK001]|uniref:hypothetical protein n=1 Tax=Kineococcus sp. SYSU DK001 TaxID=3383122 RepID=UPI003D7D6F91
MILVLVVAVAFGALNALLDSAPGPLHPAGLVLNAGFAWAGLAVLAGALLRTPARAAVGGWLSGTAGLACFYVVDAAVRDVPLTASAARFPFWAAAALVCCPLLGLVGTRVRGAGIDGLLARLVVPVGALAEVLLHPPGGAAVRWGVGLAAVGAGAVLLRRWRPAASGRSPHRPPPPPRR